MKISKRLRWFLLISIIGIVVLGIIIVNRTGSKLEIVQVETVKKRTITETVISSGKIYPSSEVRISSDVSGEIVELYVAEGDSVTKGQLLAKINPDTYLSAVERGAAALNSSKSQKSISEAQYQNALAQKEQIEAQLINAKNIFERNKKLFQDQIISLADLEASEAAYRALEANLRASQASVQSARSNIQSSDFAIKSSQASLNELRTSLDRTSIYSPTDGVVTRLSVEKGERVVGTIQMTGTEMMRVANLAGMEVQVEVSESDILRLRIGQASVIEVDAYNDLKFTGKVIQIANSASVPAGSAGQNLTPDQISNFLVRVAIDPESYNQITQKGNKLPFRPGMSASVSIETNIAIDQLSVPVQSVVVRTAEELKDMNGFSSEAEGSDSKSSQKEVVFTYKSGQAVAQFVKTGIQDETYIEIKEGLSEGDTVVSGPYSILNKKLQHGVNIKLEDK
jgi:HlyD family secretion protein